MYYTLKYLKENEQGIFVGLPIPSTVTLFKNEAVDNFKQVVNSLVEDCNIIAYRNSKNKCTLMEVIYECDTPAYGRGTYAIELKEHISRPTLYKI